MRRNRATSVRLLATAAAMAGVLVVAACEGTNLFSVTGQPVGGATGADTIAPSVTTQEAPLAKPVGYSVRLVDSLHDDVGLKSVRMFGIAKRGDKNLGTDSVIQRFAEKSITFRSGLTDTVVMRDLIPTADSTKEDVYLIVEATDTTGNIGADTVKMTVGGPDVSVVDIEDGLDYNGTIKFGVVARDPLGISSITVDITNGGTTQQLQQPFNGGDSVLFEHELDLTTFAPGSLQIVASARNIPGASGSAPTVTINVVTGETRDSIPPSLKYSVTSVERMELTDSLTIDVTGADNTQGGGVAEVGYTVRSLSTVHPGTLDTIRTGRETYATPKSGVVRTTFKVAPFNVDSMALPDPLSYQVTVYMKDAAGNCGASVGLDSLVSLPCDSLPGGVYQAQDQTPLSLSRTIVSGRTVLLPHGGKIMDAVVEPIRRNLYLSNIEENQVEVFSLTQKKFLQPMGVGSAPWGLTLNCKPEVYTPLPDPPAPCGDTLIVGNSGGTNLSNVWLGPRTDGALGEEDSGRRLLTPDAVLFDVEGVKDDAGQLSFDPTAYPDSPDRLSFSDRPQFVARDSTGRLLYSTRVVEELSQVGTIRKAENKAGYKQPEVKILIEHAKGEKAANFWRVGHVDAVGGGASITFFDHTPGDPTSTLVGTAAGSVPDAPDSAAALIQPQSDIFIVKGQRWNINNVGFSDTTFVAASGDGGWVVFGDGNVSPVGRVIMYNAAADVISGSIAVGDLMSNAGEQVEGIGLNYDGTMGVVRGVGQVSFFTPDLRLQGSPSLSITGGSGAVLHPLHADAQSLTNPVGEYRPDTHLAFIGTGEHTVDVYDTFKFRRIGRVFIRDNINGPLRAALPFDADNKDATGTPLNCHKEMVTDQSGNDIGEAIQIFQGGDFLNPWPADAGPGGTEDRCVVVKLYGVTDSGGVAVINVRKSDVLRDHPSRQ